jgi:hypothetical protein
MHRSLKIQTFQLTSNDPTSLIENIIFLELGLYCSKYCVSTVETTAAAIVTPECYTNGERENDAPPMPYKPRSNKVVFMVFPVS